MTLADLVEQVNALPTAEMPADRHRTTNETHLVSVSSGLGSAFAWKQVCDRYGPENVTGIFTDVNGEHPDNYRFLAATQYALGSRLVKLTNNGRTIWDVMVEAKFLANTRVDVCSRILKREPILRYMRENCDPARTTLYLGIDWTEEHRFRRAEARWAKDGWRTAAPLCEPPYLLKSEAQLWLDAEGIKRPLLYDLGFSHANCGGGCVKSGIGQFKLLLSADRRWYINWWENGEEYVRRSLDRYDIAILRDRRGGITRPLTLRELRERVEADPQCRFEGDADLGGCGCFTDFEDDAA